MKGFLYEGLCPSIQAFHGSGKALNLKSLVIMACIKAAEPFTAAVEVEEIEARDNTIELLRGCSFADH